MQVQISKKFDLQFKCSFHKQSGFNKCTDFKRLAFLRCLDDLLLNCIFHKQSGSEIKVKPDPNPKKRIHNIANVCVKGDFVSSQNFQTCLVIFFENLKLCCLFFNLYINSSIIWLVIRFCCGISPLNFDPVTQFPHPQNTRAKRFLGTWHRSPCSLFYLYLVIFFTPDKNILQIAFQTFYFYAVS